MVLVGLLVLPVVAGQDEVPDYGLRAELDSLWADLGQGAAASLVVTQDGSPAPGVFVAVTVDGRETERVSNELGAITITAYNGADPGVQDVRAQVTAVYRGGGRAPATSPELDFQISWSRVLLDMTAPAGPHEAGSAVPFTAAASWVHDGSPIEGMRVHFSGPSHQYRFTGPDGKAVVHFTHPGNGTLTVQAGVDLEDRPHRIASDLMPTATAEFLPAQEPTGAPPAGGGSGGGGGGGSGGGGGGGGGSGGGPDADGDGVADDQDVDDDNDGVPDTHDAYPDDPTESADSDGNGIGDAAEPVQEAMGVTLTATPSMTSGPGSDGQEEGSTKKDTPWPPAAAVLVALLLVTRRWMHG